MCVTPGCGRRKDLVDDGSEDSTNKIGVAYVELDFVKNY